jgi:hypothetical protein
MTAMWTGRYPCCAVRIRTVSGQRSTRYRTRSRRAASSYRHADRASCSGIMKLAGPGAGRVKHWGSSRSCSSTMARISASGLPRRRASDTNDVEAARSPSSAPSSESESGADIIRRPVTCQMSSWFWDAAARIERRRRKAASAPTLSSLVGARSRAVIADRPRKIAVSSYS